MIIQNTVKTETNSTLNATAFTIESNPLVFDILSNKLYNDKYLAIVRELISNAYDSQKEAGTLNIPIDVHLPTELDTKFSIRDYGVGLSKDDVLNMYSSYFRSTKRDSNELIGGFGLGSKTPFAYTPIFTVTSWFNGTKNTYLMVQKDGYPTVSVLKEEFTDEVNGLELSFNVKDNYRFFTEAYSTFIKDKNTLNINCNLDISAKSPYHTEGNITVYKLPFNTHETFYIKQGLNTFEIDSTFKNLFEEETTKLYKHYNSFEVYYEVPIGTFNITPSREALIKDETFKKNIRLIFEEIVNLLKDEDKEHLIELLPPEYSGDNIIKLLKELGVEASVQNAALWYHNQVFTTNNESIIIKQRKRRNSSRELGKIEFILLDDDTITKSKIDRYIIQSFRNHEGRTATICIFTQHVEHSILEKIKTKYLKYAEHYMDGFGNTFSIKTFEEFISANPLPEKESDFGKKTYSGRLKCSLVKLEKGKQPYYSSMTSKEDIEDSEFVKIYLEDFIPTITNRYLIAHTQEQNVDSYTYLYKILELFNQDKQGSFLRKYPELKDKNLMLMCTECKKNKPILDKLCDYKITAQELLDTFDSLKVVICRYNVKDNLASYKKLQESSNKVVQLLLSLPEAKIPVKYFTRYQYMLKNYYSNYSNVYIFASSQAITTAINYSDKIEKYLDWSVFRLTNKTLLTDFIHKHITQQRKRDAIFR